MTTDYTVSIIECSSYDKALVHNAIIELLRPIGGLDAYVKPNTTVLLKPNMLSCKSPDAAATTHPIVVEVVTEMCQNIGARVIIGDSPPIIFGKTVEYWEKTGYKRVAENTGAKLLCFETDAKRSVNFITNKKKVEIHVVETLFSVDTVINLPKMKTHNLTRITGAVKNLYGLIPGLEKAKWHGVFVKSTEFGHFIADFASQLPVNLNIMDGVEGMDGQGPAGGRVVKPGKLLASSHPVSLDFIFCEIAGIASSTVSFLNRCQAIGYGPNGLNDIEIIGSSNSIRDFDVPPTPISDKIPDFVINILRKVIWAGPNLEGKCLKCGRCVRVCPVEAIDLKTGRAVFDRDKCVSCFCCMEVCPEDIIEMKLSPLLKIGHKMRKLKKNMKISRSKNSV